jgi:hypothetical protein
LFWISSYLSWVWDKLRCRHIQYSNFRTINFEAFNLRTYCWVNRNVVFFMPKLILILFVRFLLLLYFCNCEVSRTICKWDLRYLFSNISFNLIIWFHFKLLLCSEISVFILLFRSLFGIWLRLLNRLRLENRSLNQRFLMICKYFLVVRYYSIWNIYITLIEICFQTGLIRFKWFYFSFKL